MARQGALFSLHAGSERRELSATPIPAQFLGARNCQGASRLRCHPRRDQGGKGRAVSLGDETALPALQFSFLRPFWSQRSTFKLSFDVKHASLVDRHGPSKLYEPTGRYEDTATRAVRAWSDSADAKFLDGASLLVSRIQISTIKHANGKMAFLPCAWPLACGAFR